MKKKLFFILTSLAKVGNFFNSKLFMTFKANFDGDIIPIFSRSDENRHLSASEKFALIYHAFKASKKSDIILLWGEGGLFFLLLALIYRKRHLVFYNLIYYYDDIQSMKAKVIFHLIKKSLQSGYLKATVNSEKLPNIYSSIFDCSPTFFPLVHDFMEVSDIHVINKLDKKVRYIFFGGKAERDVPNFINIVKSLPQYNFVCVISSKMKVVEMDLLSNLKVYTDISLQKFDEILGNAYICCIPLKSKFPCGLLVLMKAACCGIPIVASETFSTITIIPDRHYGFLSPIGDYKSMVKQIERLMDDEKLYDNISQRNKNRSKLFSLENTGKELASLFK